MSACLVIVQKTYAGDTWENTHCVGVGTDFTTRPSDADLTTLGAGSLLSASTTSGGAGTNFLQRLLNFERLFAYTTTTISRIYVTDGKRNRLGGTEYYTASLNLAGLIAAPADVSTIAPGSIALQINRNPVGFSQRPGRMFMRGILVDAEVAFGGPKMLTWTAATNKTAYINSLVNDINSSGLGTHFSGGANIGNGVYLIPKYRRTVPTPPRPNQEGELIGGAVVASMTMGDPTTRQAKRGRRRKQQ